MRANSCTAVCRRSEGTITKNAGQVRLRFALAYPNTYFVGMSNLGMQTMYRVINQRPDTVCERVFLPDTLPRTPGTLPAAVVRVPAPAARFPYGGVFRLV